MTPEELTKLRELSDALFREAMSTAPELPGALQRAMAARDQATAVLMARAATTSEPALRGLLDGAVDDLRDLFDQSEAMTIAFLKMPLALKDAHDEGVVAADRAIAIGNIQPAAVLAEAKASKQFDRPLKSLGVGVIGLIVGEAVDSYTDTAEGFLGHKAGSIRIGERVKAVAEAGLKDTVGLVAPPFFDTFREVVKQVTTSQINQDIAALQAETGERMFRLRRLLEQLRNQSSAGAGFIATSKEMATEAARNEGRILRIGSSLVAGQ